VMKREFGKAQIYRGGYFHLGFPLQEPGKVVYNIHMKKFQSNHRKEVPYFHNHADIIKAIYGSCA